MKKSNENILLDVKICWILTAPLGISTTFISLVGTNSALVIHAVSVYKKRYKISTSAVSYFLLIFDKSQFLNLKIFHSYCFLEFDKKFINNASKSKVLAKFWSFWSFLTRISKKCPFLCIYWSNLPWNYCFISVSPFLLWKLSRKKFFRVLIGD